MPEIKARIRCPECRHDVTYTRDNQDPRVVIETSRALALAHHDTEEHWPTVASTGSVVWLIRCAVCHGPVTRFTARNGRTVTFPCGHREGVEHQETLLREPTGRLILVNGPSHTTWIVKPHAA